MDSEILKQRRGKNIRIALIDSGLDRSIHVAQANLEPGIRITPECIETSSAFGEAGDDPVGHGTAVAGIILGKAPEAILTPVQLVDTSETYVYNFPVELLVEALKWTLSRNFHIVHLSMGITGTKHKNYIHPLCKQIAERSIIVSAAHYKGGISYPAYFDEVIGVGSGDIKDSFQYIYKENSPIEILAYGGMQRVHWKDGKRIFLDGTSLAAAHMTGIIALILENNPDACLKVIRTELKRYSVIPPKPEKVKQDDSSDDGFVRRNHGDSSEYLRRSEPASALAAEGRYGFIKRAVIYPFIKEMHAFIRFQDLLSFEVVSIVDHIGKGCVGKDAGELIGMEALNLPIGHCLRDSLTEADTLILGHMDIISRISKRDRQYEIIEQAVEQGKHVFSFDLLPEDRYRDLFAVAEKKGLRLATPAITKKDFEKACSRGTGDLDNAIPVPVLGVFGTSSYQGKFTTQLVLRRELMKRHYEICQIGTEHHAELFGFDLAFPLGYNVTGQIDIKLGDWGKYIKRRVFDLIYAKDIDIVITGGQAGLLPYNLNLAQAFAGSIKNMTLICILNPDAVILAINAYDPVQYIRRSIQLVELLCGAQVIALTLNPFAMEKRDFRGRTRVFPVKMNEEKYKAKLEELNGLFGILTIDALSENGGKCLCDAVIDFFSRDGTERRFGCRG